MLKNSAKNRKLNIAKNSGIQKKKEIVLPLYFGYQIRIAIEKIKNLKEHIFGPFKTYKQYISAVFVLIMITSISIYIYKYNNQTKAATYNWEQTSWSGGQSTATATHPIDNNNWTQYSEADPSLIIGNNIDLSSTTIEYIHTSAEDYSTGIGIGIDTSGGQITLDLP